MNDDILRAIERGHAKAKERAAQLGENVNDMLFTINTKKGEEKAVSISEHNKEGEVMSFVCCRINSNLSHVVPNSHVMECDGCGEKVWMSPGTKIAFDKIKKKIILCLDCMRKQMKKEQENAKSN